MYQNSINQLKINALIVVSKLHKQGVSSEEEFGSIKEFGSIDSFKASLNFTAEKYRFIGSSEFD